ncbi:REP-associated tyrosine transposase [Clostridium algidicarnis]|uniref:REP-associated tyrosine transposase n=1 Tax=Clostridium algidicarnis TaxID=37659 RepID=UPI00209B066C|nr:transposase [Clostridium algidicarnis]
MPEPKRVWVPDSSYHITTRGNRKSDIFKDSADYSMYLLLIKDCLNYYEEFSYEIICYCLMTNHVHLIVKTNEKEASTFMRRLNSMYAKYFNKKYDYRGHLYQDRYFSNLIQTKVKLLEISRYIHLNPVRANMVRLPEDYNYSSYSMYIGTKEERLINSDDVLSNNILLNDSKFFDEGKDDEVIQDVEDIEVTKGVGSHRSIGNDRGGGSIGSIGSGRNVKYRMEYKAFVEKALRRQ